MRLRKIAVGLFLLLVGLGGGAIMGAPEAGAQSETCDFERCFMGKCDGNTNDLTNCSGEAPCEITDC